jgi:hypothetical protein
VQRVARLLQKLPAGTELTIDYTGVGRPVADMFAAAGLAPILVLIAGGASETYDGGIVGVPKLALVSRLQALLHKGRLKIHKDLAEAPTLVRELQDFRCEYTVAGSLTFAARAGKHDDLVLALAITIATRCAYGGGPAAGWLEFYRREHARITGAAEPVNTVVGVDLGQVRDATAIAVVQRVPASPLEERPDRPRHELRMIKPTGEALYQPASVERAEQDASRL